MNRVQSEKTDEEIVLLVQRGDTEQFGELVERYEEKLLRYGRKFLSRREDIQDIVQDIFISTYQNIQNFDTLQRFSPWIYRIAHNAFVNRLKKNSYNPLILVDFDTLVSHPVYEDPAPLEREQKEMRVMIDRGLEELAPKYREILILHYLEDMSYKEISDILQIPGGTVGIRLKRAKEALKKVYETMNLHHE
ncbi:MAG: RNA polymerase sigma factor [Candidatus Pacebacteria bacterium]|jgi:RNA polymerase sigma-70 factor (ECF subfamily)|nr:RNA polymerase sigma factor [Candidatus Paceibacterota bacterium]